MTIKNKDTIIQQFFQKSEEYPSVLDFPKKPGLYMIGVYNNTQIEPIYIGQAKNLYVRWKKHHKKSDVYMLEKLNHQLEYRALVIEPWLLTLSPNILHDIETNLIEVFAPYINYRK